MQTKLKTLFVWLMVCLGLVFLKYQLTGEIVPQAVAKVSSKKADIAKEKRAYAKALAKKYKTLTVSSSTKLVELVYKHSKRNGVPVHLGFGIIAVESNFNSRARSKSGAVGYTQVLPRWHKDKIKGRNIMNPEVNIEVGMSILKSCMDLYRDEKKMLGCYNGSIKGRAMARYSKKVIVAASQINKLAYQEMLNS